MRYKVGQKVIVKNHIIEDICSDPSCAFFTEGMKKHIGKTVTIDGMLDDGGQRFRIDGSTMTWSSCMVTPAKNYIDPRISSLF